MKMIRLSLDWWWRIRVEVRFMMAGAFNTLMGYTVFSGLFLLMGRWIHYLLVGWAAHLIAVVIAFAVHRKLVFRSAEPWRASFIRFNLSQLTALAFGSAALFALVEFARWNPLLGQAAVTVCSVALNYTLHKHFSFRKRLVRQP